MTGFQGSELYRTKEQVLAAFIAAWQTSVPDVWIGEDGTLMIMLTIESAQIEGLYLANQLALEDMFIQTASTAGLQRHGAEIGLDQLPGSPATGNLLFSGEGGVYIPTGTEAGLDPGGGMDVLYYETIIDGTVPNPGIPSSPTVADGGVAGALTGTFEWGVTFLTGSGETLLGAISDALLLSGSTAQLSNVPLGGPGTTGRNIYRSVDGGEFQLVMTLGDNITTDWFDDVASPLPTAPPINSTANEILLAAQSEDNGMSYNAAPSAISLLTDAPPGLTSVINPLSFVGGSDPEDTERYRTRLLEWYRTPQTGSPSDLEAWAETVDGVDSATAFTNQNAVGNVAPGTITIRISGVGGSIPDPTVVSAVQNLLESYGLANITIVVDTFTATPIDVTVTLTPAPGFTSEQLAPSVEEAISNYIDSVPTGGTLYIAGIITAVMGVTGVDDVSVSYPTDNQTIPAQNKFTSGTITVE